MVGALPPVKRGCRNTTGAVACGDMLLKVRSRGVVGNGKRHERFLWLITTLIQIYIWLLIAQAVLSWLIAFGIVNRHNRIVGTIEDFLWRITEPALRPIRRILPNLGGIDISPMILILLLLFVQRCWFLTLPAPVTRRYRGTGRDWVALRLTPRATADRIVATAVAAADGLAIVGGAASRPRPCILRAARGCCSIGRAPGRHPAGSVNAGAPA